MAACLTISIVSASLIFILSTRESKMTNNYEGGESRCRAKKMTKLPLNSFTTRQKNVKCESLGKSNVQGQVGRLCVESKKAGTRV